MSEQAQKMWQYAKPGQMCLMAVGSCSMHMQEACRHLAVVKNPIKRLYWRQAWANWSPLRGCAFISPTLPTYSFQRLT